MTTICQPFGQLFANILANLLSSYDPHKYRNDIENADWSDVITEEDPNRATDKFLHKFTNIIDRYAPYKNIKCKGQQARWVTNELLALIDDREYWSNKFKKNPSPDNEAHKKLAQTLVHRMKEITTKRISR